MHSKEKFIFSWIRCGSKIHNSPTAVNTHHWLQTDPIKYFYVVRLYFFLPSPTMICWCLVSLLQQICWCLVSFCLFVPRISITTSILSIIAFLLSLRLQAPGLYLLPSKPWLGQWNKKLVSHQYMSSLLSTCMCFCIVIKYKHQCSLPSL